MGQRSSPIRFAIDGKLPWAESEPGDVRMIQIIDTDDQGMGVPHPCRHHASRRSSGADYGYRPPRFGHHRWWLSRPCAGVSFGGAEAVPNNENGVPDHRAHDRACVNLPSDVVGRRRVVLLPLGPGRTDRSATCRLAKQLLDEQADAAETTQLRRQTLGRQ